jgi:hypothetical protein
MCPRRKIELLISSKIAPIRAAVVSRLRDRICV